MIKGLWLGPAGMDLGVWAAYLLPLVIWTLVWKGLALWRAARRGEQVWFVVLLIVNTVGILEIIYLLLTRKKEGTPVQTA